MIRLLHSLFIRDWLLKVFALALATLTWLAVTFAIKHQAMKVEDSAKRYERNVFDLPVLLVASDADVSGFKCKPAEVDMVLQGEEETVKNPLTVRQVRILVDLTGNKPSTNTMRRVEVITPPGVTCVSVRPEAIEVIVPPALPPQSKPK